MPAETKPTMGRGTVGNAWRVAEGDYIRELRLAKGLTQAELAEAVGMVSKQTICQIETGRGHVPPERCHEFASVLGVDLREFCTALLRWQNPWLFAGVLGCDPQLASELRKASARLRTPRVSPRDR